MMKAQSNFHLLAPKLAEKVQPLGIWFVGAPEVGKSSYIRKHFPGAYSEEHKKLWDGYRGEPYCHLEDLVSESTKSSRWFEVSQSSSIRFSRIMLG